MAEQRVSDARIAVLRYSSPTSQAKPCCGLEQLKPSSVARQTAATHELRLHLPRSMSKDPLRTFAATLRDLSVQSRGRGLAAQEKAGRELEAPMPSVLAPSPRSHARPRRSEPAASSRPGDRGRVKLKNLDYWRSERKAMQRSRERWARTRA